MLNPVKRILATALVISTAIPATAFATNGYFLIGFGAKSRGMGGTGVANAQDGMAAAANPAGMTDAGVSAMRVDVGAELFNPPRSIRQDSSALESGFPGSDSGVRHKSGSNLFLIPSMGMIYKFNRKMYVGMAAIGAGLGTRYKQDVPGNPSCMNGNTSGGSASTFFNFNCNADSQTVGVVLYQMQMLPSIAYKLDKTHSVGASLAIGVQSFRAYGIGAFEDLGFAASKEHVSGEGNDWSMGAGVRLGWLGKFLDGRLNLGANYASRVYMTKFKKYENLFAEQGSFDIPEHFSFGLAIKPTKKITLAGDVQHIRFSSVRSVGNQGPSVTDPGDFNINGSCGKSPDNPTGADTVDPDNCKMGGDDGVGFGWQDQWAYKVGVNYDYNAKWSFRGGYNYGKSPIPDDQVLLNTLAPATVEHHITVGASYRPSKAIEWSLSYMHALEHTIKGPTAFGPTGDPAIDSEVNSTSISMKQRALGIGFAYSM